ncbi:MAG: hypothetical protein V4498_05080 [candidate division FCPU426 bacterium]
MNLKETAYRAAKAALVAGGVVLSGSLANGLPTSKTALYSIGAAVIAGAAHAAINAVEQAMGFSTTLQTSGPPKT